MEKVPKALKANPLLSGMAGLAVSAYISLVSGAGEAEDCSNQVLVTMP